MTSIAGALAALLGAVPRILGFLVIVVVGWFIASLIAKGVAILLRSVKFNELAQRAGLSDFVSKMGVRSDSAGFLAGIAKWFVRLIALVVAFDALGLPAVSQVLQQFLLWLPNAVVALVVLVIGGLAAKALSAVVHASAASAHLGNPRFLAKVASTLTWAFTIVVAVNQLGIAQALVNTLFMAAVGAIALALGLAFGLGSRDTAGKIVRDWYDRRPPQGSAREAVESAADVVNQAREAGEAGIRNTAAADRGVQRASSASLERSSPSST